ncbi:MAG: DUF6783 domain-containing protein [Blautia faecis]
MPFFYPSYQAPECVWKIVPTNCDAHLAESLFQTCSGTMKTVPSITDKVQFFTALICRCALDA